MHIQFYSDNPKGYDQLTAVVVDRKLILKWMLCKYHIEGLNLVHNIDLSTRA